MCTIHFIPTMYYYIIILNEIIFIYMENILHFENYNMIELFELLPIYTFTQVIRAISKNHHWFFLHENTDEHIIIIIII